MKHLTFFLLFLACCVQSAMATEVVVDGLKYSLNTDAKTAEVVRNSYSGDIVIPATIVTDGTEYTVTSLAKYCFSYCESLTSINIPEGVISLGDNCFFGCSSLTSVNIPESVTSLGNYCFRGCAGLACIKVADGNTVYDSRGNCNAIIETATNSMIVGCSNTIIPGSVTSLGNYCFGGYSSLTSINIPESVTSLGDYCFYGCSSLTSINIPESVTSLGDECFSYCRSLNSITIPESVTSLGDECFKDCTGLTCIKVAEGNAVYDSRGNCNAIIETATISMIVGCSNTIIPGSVTSLGNYCFSYCDSLTSINIPEGVISLGDNCFYGCSSLTSVNIPESVTSIGYQCFGFCENLASINIPESVTSLGDGCFLICSSLTSINIPKGLTSLGDNCFMHCSSLASINIPESVTSLGDYCFYNCSSLSSVTLPESVTSLGEDCFSGCAGLTSIKVVESNAVYDSRGNCNAIIETATNSMIFGCSATIIPESVTSLGADCFFICSNLSNVTLPESIISLGDYCFTGSSLASISIPDGVISLGDGCFSDCSNLTRITSLAETPPTTGYNVFEGCDSLEELYVKSGSIDAYKSTSPWSKISDIRPIIDAITLTESASVEPQKAISLEVMLQPGSATADELTWTSSDESVATVDADGIVKGISHGTATITATAKDGLGAVASCLVTVTSQIDGIESVTSEGNLQRTVYYTLDGVQLQDKPQKEGVYIRVTNGKSQKIVISHQ